MILLRTLLYTYIIRTCLVVEIPLFFGIQELSSHQEDLRSRCFRLFYLEDEVGWSCIKSLASWIYLEDDVGFIISNSNLLDQSGSF